MVRKFDKNVTSWFIALFPTIAVLTAIADKVVGLGIGENDGCVVLILFVSLPVDFVAIFFIRAILKLYDEYGN